MPSLLVPGLQPWNVMRGRLLPPEKTREAGASRAVCSEAGAAEQGLLYADAFGVRRQNFLMMAVVARRMNGSRDVASSAAIKGPSRSAIGPF